MEPIVYEVKKQYKNCIQVERVNYHVWTSWHELIAPLVSPEFALLDGQKNILHRWFGVIEKVGFTEILNSLCRG